MVKNLFANAGDVGLIPRLEKSPGEGNGNPLQYLCSWRIPWTQLGDRAHTHISLMEALLSPDLQALCTLLGCPCLLFVPVGSSRALWEHSACLVTQSSVVPSTLSSSDLPPCSRLPSLPTSTGTQPHAHMLSYMYTDARDHWLSRAQSDLLEPMGWGLPTLRCLKHTGGNVFKWHPEMKRQVPSRQENESQPCGWLSSEQRRGEGYCLPAIHRRVQIISPSLPSHVASSTLLTLPEFPPPPPLSSEDTRTHL